MKRNSPSKTNPVRIKPPRALEDIVAEEKETREKETAECQAISGHVQKSLEALEKLEKALHAQEIELLRLQSDVKGKQRALKVFKEREVCCNPRPLTALHPDVLRALLTHRPSCTR